MGTPCGPRAASRVVRPGAVMAAVVALTGCRQLLGLDDVPTPPTDATAIDGDVNRDASGDAPAVDAGPVTATVTFQDGAGSYALTADTYIDSGSPNADNATDGQMRWRSGASTRHGLIRFAQLFDTEGGPIPAGSTIDAATLQLTITNSNSAATIHEVAIPWLETVTFNTLGASPGVDAGDVGAMVADAPTTDGVHLIDVRASLTQWAATPAANNGWIIIPNGSMGGGDTSARSRETLVVADRPRLSVTYTR